MILSVFANGVMLGGALILAIGAQNMFVLRQGMARDQVFVVALLCSIIDASLIIAGSLGLGTLISAFPALVPITTLGGAAFLICFGGYSFYRAFKSGSTTLPEDGEVTSSLKKAVLMTLAFGFLNPHVYLDTVILVGGIAAAYEMSLRVYFMAGAVLASFVWFFALAYGARLLSPLMRHPMGARTLDFLVGCLMLIVAVRLVMGFVEGQG